MWLSDWFRLEHTMASTLFHTSISLALCVCVLLCLHPLLIHAGRNKNIGVGNIIERFYMVGDNPATDICGANEAGGHWRSVLCRSGLWQVCASHT